MVPIIIASVSAIGTWAAPANAEDSRDRMIFGDRQPTAKKNVDKDSRDSSESLPPSTRSDSRDNMIFGGKQSAERKLDRDSKEFIDPLQIGARLELRETSSRREDQTWAKSGTSLLKQADVYFDAIPKPHVHFFLRLRFSETTPVVPANATPPTTPNPSTGQTSNQQGQGQGATKNSPNCANCAQVQVDEVWAKWDYKKRLFFTYGKQHLKWGSGHFWNPTDFTANQPIDPFQPFDYRLGQEMLKIHLPVEGWGDNFYAVALLDNMDRNEDAGLALRAEFTLGKSGELALSAATRRGQAQKLGADLSVGVGPFDFHAEAAATRRDPRLFYRGSLSEDSAPAPTSYTKPDTWIGQFVTGLEKTWKYSSTDNFTLGLEYFLNNLGYEDRWLELYSVANAQSTPLFAGRRYAAAYLLLPKPGPWDKTTILVSGIKNLSDQTSEVWLTDTWEFRPKTNLQLFVSGCRGNYGDLCFRVPRAWTAPLVTSTGTTNNASSSSSSSSSPSAFAALPTERTVVNVGVSVIINF